MTHRTRLLAVLAVAAAASTLTVIAGSGAGAAPGDPLTSFGTGGTVVGGTPTGCNPCPTAAATITRSVLESGGGLAIHGYEWTGPASLPGDGSAPTTPASGAAIAVTDGASVSWNVAVGGGSGERGRVLAVGYQPSPARVVAVIAIDQAAATLADPTTTLRQEIRRYTTAGTLSSTTSLPVAANGAWATAEVAPDGSVVGIENGSTGELDLPSDTIRRYDIAGTLRWTKVLATGDGIDDAAVSSTGRVVLAGSTADVPAESYDALLVALTDGGELDATFGTAGRIVSPAATGSGRAFTAVAASGAEVAAVGIEEWTPTDPDLDADEGPGALVVARTSGGALTTSFDGDGIALAPWTPTAGERLDPTDVLLDGTQVVVAGSAVQADLGDTDARLLRFTAAGALDGTFTVDGTVADRFPAVASITGGYLASTSTPIDPAPTSWSTTLRAYASASGPPAGPPAPGTPTVTSAGARRAVLAWTAPSGGPTGYDVLVDLGANGTTDLTSTVATAGTTIDDLPAGQAYRFAVRARSTVGLGPRSAWSAVAIPPFRTVDAFTDRQHLDFAGRAATSTERSAWRTAIGNGTLTPVQAVSNAVDFANWGPKQGPIIRLYRAYFGRLPDRSGLDYWTNKSRRGTTLVKISATFAASSEFIRKYGSLSNRAFVQLVYQNVLGRPGEASGVAFWTNQLDTKRKNRGQVMVNFSESSEYKRKTAGLVEVVNLYTGLLRRVPSTAEVDLWAPVVTARGRGPLIESLLSSDAYDGRIA